MVNYSGQALITFSYDDGRKNNYDVALPLHEEFNIPASFAIIAGRTIDPKYWSRHMEPWQVTMAHLRGVEIASHGLSHKEKFPDLSDEALALELEESKKILKGLVPGRDSVDSICIPFSSVNPNVLERAKASYSIVRVHGKKLNDILSSDRVVYSYGLRNSTSFLEVKDVIDQAVAEKKWIVLMLHGVVDESIASGKYDVTRAFLREVLDYVSKLGSGTLLPVKFKDLISFRSNKKGSRFHRPKIDGKGAYLLADDDGYMITYHKNEMPTDKVLISFGGLPSKKTKTGFGSQFILRQGYDHIFVAQEALSQYQKLSLKDFCKAVEPYIKGKDVFTYGSSLGGYAAIYYGGAIDAAIISAAPKNSAHHSVRKRKFDHVVFNHSELVDNPRSNVPPVILYDPLRQEESDYINNYVLPAYPNACLIKLPYAGHTVLNTMLQSGVLKRFITSYVNNGVLIDVKLDEEESYIWNAEKGREALLNGDLYSAENFFLRSNSIKLNAEAVKGMANILMKRGDMPSARNLMEKFNECYGSFKGIPESLVKKAGL